MQPDKVPIQTCVTQQWCCVRMALTSGLRELKPASRGLFKKKVCVDVLGLCVQGLCLAVIVAGKN